MAYQSTCVFIEFCLYEIRIVKPFNSRTFRGRHLHRTVKRIHYFWKTEADRASERIRRPRQLALYYQWKFGEKKQEQQIHCVISRAVRPSILWKVSISVYRCSGQNLELTPQDFHAARRDRQESQTNSSTDRDVGVRYFVKTMIRNLDVLSSAIYAVVSIPEMEPTYYDDAMEISGGDPYFSCGPNSPHWCRRGGKQT
jgi:hypothetical protein